MADKFNAYNPPKKIDFLRMSVIELADGSGAYHMEAFIDGEYIKHNSNAGYVADESQAGVSRRTPQCFSHFTYVHRTVSQWPNTFQQFFQLVGHRTKVFHNCF